MSISKLYISLFQDPDWPIEAVPVFTKKDLSTAIKADTSLICKTTIYDIDILDIDMIIDHADEIYLLEDSYPPDSQGLKNWETFQLLNKLADRNVANAVTIRDYITLGLNMLHATRSTDKSILWTAGCSVTAGSGVDWEQRYGYLLAEKLGMPEVSLSRTGASIGWAADQILRSEIRSGDTVVWGLTDTTRVDLEDNFSLKSCPGNQYFTSVHKEKQYWNIDYFGSLSQEVSAARSVLQVINYCSKIGVKLVLANLLNITIMPMVLRNYKNTIDLTTEEYLDLGTDNDHPGPKHHRHYANEIYNLIEGNNNG